MEKCCFWNKRLQCWDISSKLQKEFLPALLFEHFDNRIISEQYIFRSKIAHLILSQAAQDFLKELEK